MPSRPASRGDGGHASRQRPSKPTREQSLRSDDETLRLWGTHVIEAALSNPARVIRRLHLTENAESRLASALSRRCVEMVRSTPRDLDRLVGADAVHQGAVADVEPLPDTGLATLVQAASAGNRPIVVLDQVTDPHNVGAILRSAAVFGAAGLIMTRRQSPPLGGVLGKSASGALEVVPIALVPNLARALAELGDAGVTRIGLDGHGEYTIDAKAFVPPVALILGSEGKGLRRLTREHCDRLCRIGSVGSLASLNVSNAAAVALYAASQRR